MLLSPAAPMAHYSPGTVVVHEALAAGGFGQPAERTLATVIAGPHEDGTYDLDYRQGVRPESIYRLCGGERVEYYSASMSQWIPARVLRWGRAPGTFDLDCKEAVPLNRMRLPAVEALAEATTGQPQAEAPLPPPAVAPPAAVPAPPSAAPAANAAPSSSGCGPPGLEVGEQCFYNSATHGWIPARVVQCHPEDGTHDLDVKQRVHQDALYCVREGSLIEYQSTSTNKWIPARVLWRCQEPDGYDLDCKLGVSISRLRPPGPAALLAAKEQGVGQDLYMSAASAASPSASSSTVPPAAHAAPRSIPSSAPTPAVHGELPAKLSALSSAPHAAAHARVSVPPAAPSDSPSSAVHEGMLGPPSAASNTPPAVVRGGLPPPAPSSALPPAAQSGVPGSRLSIAPPAAFAPTSPSYVGGASAFPPHTAAPNGTPAPFPEPGASNLLPSLPGSHASFFGSNPWSAGELGNEQHAPWLAAPHSAQDAAQPVPKPQDSGQGEWQQVSTAAKLEELRQAVQAEDAQALRQCLDSQSVLRLQGEELDQASHMLWALEARPAAQAELRSAAAATDPVALEAAMEAAAAAGVADNDLQAAACAMRALQARHWRYLSEDGMHVDIRASPWIDGPRTEYCLEHGEVFHVSQEWKGDDGVLYLELADGRGWVFDCKPGIGTMCVRYQDDCPGPYVITHDKTAVTPTIELGTDEEIVAKLGFGAIVNVVDVGFADERIRGRIINPTGWISLTHPQSGKRWAHKHAN